MERHFALVPGHEEVSQRGGRGTVTEPVDWQQRSKRSRRVPAPRSESVQRALSVKGWVPL